MKFKFFSLAVVFVFFLSFASPSFAAFKDVRTSTKYRDAILYAQTEGIVSGYPDGSFRPNSSVSRIEFTKIIVEAIFPDSEIVRTYELPFRDVDVNEWYSPYLSVAVQAGIITGYHDGTFHPGNDISFAEAATIISRAFQYEITADSVWYKPHVENLAERNAIPPSLKNFDQRVTRGEMVEMIHRLREGLIDLPSVSYEVLAGVSVDVSRPVQPVVTVGSPVIGKCPIFPSDNPWNTDISSHPVHPNSANYISSIGSSKLHPDFGGNGDYGIPYEVVNADQPKVPLLSIEYEDESDPGPYPIPNDVRVEGGGDRHVLVVDQDNCKLYELFAAEKVSGGWNAGSAAIFDLLSNDLRPDGWTSADAAGLPILPGLVRYDEVASGEINHAIRFTVKNTQRGYIHPATHFASSSTDPNRPPMGLRVRLNADYDLSGLSGHALVIATAMKKYGMILADNGSNWYFTGAMDVRWDDDNLNQLKSIPGSEFEAVYTGEIHK